MIDRRRIVVLGGGLAGSATAAFLGGESDVDVTLIEREPRHDAHSSGRSAEILRVAVDDPVTRTLARESARALAEPTAVGLSATAPWLDARGLLIAVGEEPAWAGELVDEGLAEALDEDARRARAPHFEPVGERTYALPAGGRIVVERLLPALVRAACARGVRVLRSTGPARVVVEGGVARAVECPVHGRIDADDVVVAAGAWTKGIAESLGLTLPLRPTRRHAFVTTPDPALDPAAPVVWDDVAGFYARPEGSGWGISICDVVDADPDDTARYAVDEAALRRASSLVARHLPGRDLALARGWTGLRDLTPDDRPILGPDGRVDGLHWCAGLGGHGLTLSLAVGRATRDAVLGRPDPVAAQCARRRFESAARV